MTSETSQRHRLALVTVSAAALLSSVGCRAAATPHPDAGLDGDGAAVEGTSAASGRTDSTAVNLATPRVQAPVSGGAPPVYQLFAGGPVPGLAPAQYGNGGAAGMPMPLALPASGRASQDEAPEGADNESYVPSWDNPFLEPTSNPWSTFALDVDTASFSNVRRFLSAGEMPPIDAIRIEELVNYFRYADPDPAGDDPFAVHVEIGAAPWEPSHRLVRVGLRGRPMAQQTRPPVNLVFLLDVSGSMQDYNKLPLVKQSMRLLVEQLTVDDRVAIVVYAGASGQALASTPGNETERILDAIDELSAGGSTAGSEGIELAYAVALEGFREGGINRVILATDGDFNVGISDRAALVRLIEAKAQTGVFLTVLGYGMGNLKDDNLEGLADHGNGSYAYIDTIDEARKVLVDEIGQTLVTIAKDVKIQVEFNPATVSAYRLLGYENRLLAPEDFNDDTKDGGEMGAGHSVTALYEVVPEGVAPPTPMPSGPIPTPTPSLGEPTPGDPSPNATPELDPLRYQGGNRAFEAVGELLTVKLRYKQPDGDVSTRMDIPFTDTGSADGSGSSEWQFAASVAAFGMVLRDSPHRGNATFDSALDLARGALASGEDPKGLRAAFVALVQLAADVQAGRAATTQPEPPTPEPLVGYPAP